MRLDEEIIRLGIWEGIRTVGVAVMKRLLDLVISDGISRESTACSPFCMRTLVGVCSGSTYEAISVVRRVSSKAQRLNFIDDL